MQIIRVAITVVGAGVFAALVYTSVSVQRRPSKPSAVPSPTADFETHTTPFLQKYCFECHSGAAPEGRVGLDTLVKDPNSIGAQSVIWERVARVLESREMPAPEASAFPTDAERDGAIRSVRT